MKMITNRVMNVFFSLSIGCVATMTRASDVVAPLVSEVEDVTDQDESTSHETVPYDHGHPGASDQCRRNDGNVYYCQQTPGCEFDRFSNICHQRSGGGGSGQYCQNFDRNEYQCLNEGCSFDRYSGRCSQGGSRPRPIPNNCRYFDRQEYQCQDAGCLYDFRSGMCRAQGQIPQPGYGFVCNASDNGYEEHYAGHQGIGQSQYAAQEAAMGDCMRHHSSCYITQCQRR